MKLFLSVVLFLCSIGLHAADDLSIHVNAKNPQFVVTLPANPSTGYSWTITSYDTKLLKVTGSKYVGPKVRRIGAGGQMQFTFTLNKGMSYPKTMQLAFTYSRTWDPKTATLKTVTIYFD